MGYGKRAFPFPMGQGKGSLCHGSAGHGEATAADTRIHLLFRHLGCYLAVADV